jgi:uncharacterized protein YneR
MRPQSTVVRKQLQKWLTELRTLASAKEEQRNVGGNGVSMGAGAGGVSAATSAVSATVAARDPREIAALRELREHVTVLLEKWIRVWQTANDQVFMQYLQLMHQYQVLRTEEAADRFFRVATELCVEACLKTGAAPGVDSGSQTRKLVIHLCA